jgi:hypothetical protein
MSACGVTKDSGRVLARWTSEKIFYSKANPEARDEQSNEVLARWSAIIKSEIRS